MERFAEHIAHVDMDAFFVEVERRRRAELRAVPVVVAGLGGRGVVTSASYEARRCGVGAGMPTVHARRLCPQARFLAPDHRAYAEASEQVFAVFAGFTPLVEPVSVDEAFLEIGGLRLTYPSPEAVGHALRAAVREQTGLPASVGLATRKLLAKLASRAAKPDGLRLVPAGGEVAFLHPLPVRALWGVGEATLRPLGGVGSAHRGRPGRPAPGVPGTPRSGPALGGHLSDLAQARDERPVEAGGPAKSVSVEETFAVGPRRHARRWKRSCSGSPTAWPPACERRRRRPRTVCLKVRFADFTTISRSQTLPGAVDTAHDLYRRGRANCWSGPAVGRRRCGSWASAAENLEATVAPRQLGLEPRALGGSGGGGGPGAAPFRSRRGAPRPRSSGATRQARTSCQNKEEISPGAWRFASVYSDAPATCGSPSCHSTTESSASSKRSSASSMRTTRKLAETVRTADAGHRLGAPARSGRCSGWSAAQR